MVLFIHTDKICCRSLSAIICFLFLRKILRWDHLFANKTISMFHIAIVSYFDSPVICISVRWKTQIVMMPGNAVHLGTSQSLTRIKNRAKFHPLMTTHERWYINIGSCVIRWDYQPFITATRTLYCNNFSMIIIRVRS